MDGSIDRNLICFSSCRPSPEEPVHEGADVSARQPGAASSELSSVLPNASRLSLRTEINTKQTNDAKHQTKRVATKMFWAKSELPWEFLWKLRSGCCSNRRNRLCPKARFNWSRRQSQKPRTMESFGSHGKPKQSKNTHLLCNLQNINRVARAQRDAKSPSGLSQKSLGDCCDIAKG